MEVEDLFKIIGFIVFGMILIYYTVKCLHLQKSMIEGLTNAEAPDTTASPSSNGEAGNAANYAAAIKAKVVQLQDELLISKYRKEYESVIINMDDYVSMLMIKLTLNMKVNDNNSKANIEILNNLNTLKNAKDSLNVTMKYLDSQ